MTVTVTGTAHAPNASAVAGATVSLLLAAGGPGYNLGASPPTHIIGRSQAVSDASGAFSFTVEYNDLLTPANTYYIVDDGEYRYPFVVTQAMGAGPFVLETLTTGFAAPEPLEDPAALTALTEHLNDAVDAHDASAISFVPTGSIGSTNVQAAIAEVAAEAATAGASAPLDSPTFTGDPKAPTPAPGDNDTSLATTAFVQAAVTAGVAAGLSGFNSVDYVTTFMFMGA